MALYNLFCADVPLSNYSLTLFTQKADLHSFDFVVNRLCTKLFNTDNKEVIKACQEYFCFRLPSDLTETKKIRFKI